MRYAEAFAALGYKLAFPRQDWSSENDTGVCISIWRVEIKMRDGLPSMDSRVDAGPIELWGTAPGNAKRRQHLRAAIDKFAGRVDVVIVEGIPGQGVKDANPWFVPGRKGAWHLTYFNPESGHFAVAVRRL
jgi:hypothetical protein